MKDMTFAWCAVVGVVAACAGSTAEKLKDESIRSVDTIYQDARFWNLVRQRRWLASPSDDLSLPGDTVVDALRRVRPKANSYVLKLLGWGHIPGIAGGTFGSTTHCQTPDPDRGRCGAIALNQKRMDRGPGEPTLVNTVAHENTHTIGDGAGPCGCDRQADAAAPSARFQDTGVGPRPSSVEVWLVSYAIGDLAQCFAEKAADDAKSLACFDQLMDGQRCNRRIVECCPSEHDTPGAADARAKMPYCRTIAPSCPAPSRVNCAYR